MQSRAAAFWDHNYERDIEGSVTGSDFNLSTNTYVHFAFSF
jgi:hypothetical protein